MDFKTSKEKQIVAWFENKENFVQFKEISREDQEVVMTRLLSETFSKVTEEVEFDQNKVYPVNTLLVGSQPYKILGCQIQFNSILDQCIQFMHQIQSSKYESSMRLIELIKVSVKVLTSIPIGL